MTREMNKIKELVKLAMKDTHYRTKRCINNKFFFVNLKWVIRYF